MLADGDINSRNDFLPQIKQINCSNTSCIVLLRLRSFQALLRDPKYRQQPSSSAISEARRPAQQLISSLNE